MPERKCVNCKFYEQKSTIVGIKGFCRRFPLSWGDPIGFGGWGRVDETDWCGEFKGE